MNKVILLGRLTRDPDVRYSSGENSTAVAVTHWLLTVDFAERVIPQLQTLSDALLSAVRQNLQRNICGRERRSPSPVGSKPEAIRTVKAGRFTQPMWLWKSRSLQRVRTRNVRGSRAQHHRQIRTVS